MYHPVISTKSLQLIRDVKRLAYINADVLVHEYGLVNHMHAETVSCASGIYKRTSKRKGALVADIRPRCTALEMPISYTFLSDCSTS